MTVKSRVILVAVGGLAVLGAAGVLALHAPSTGRDQDAAVRSVMDMTSRGVQVPAQPARILSLCTSATATIAAMGESRRLLAIDDYSRIVPGLDRVAVIGKGSDISKEQVLALKIDLAFVWWYQDDAAAMLDGLGVPVVIIRSGRAAEVPSMIRLVGDCLGCRERADALTTPIGQFLRQTSSQLPQPLRPVIYLELYSPFKTVGRDSYMNDLLELAGGRNIAADATGTVVLSAERLIQNEPDFILVVEGFADAQTIASRPGMSELKAVRAGRVYAIGRDLLIAGPNLPQAVEKLRVILATPGRTERK